MPIRLSTSPPAVASARPESSTMASSPPMATAGANSPGLLYGAIGWSSGMTPRSRTSPHRASAAWRSCAVPKLFLAGDRDFAFDAARFARELEAMPEPRRFVWLPGADHFFRKQEERVWSALCEWLFGALHASDSSAA